MSARLCTILGFFLVSSHVLAAPLIVPTAQERLLSGNAYAEDELSGPVSDADSDQAPDFGPFTTVLSADAIIDTASSSGGGQQSSSITETTIVATGNMFANAEVWEFGTFADASSTNRMRVTFQLTSTVDYTLLGELQAVDQGITELHLLDAQGVLYSELIFGTATLLPINQTGTLSPGVYTLELLTQGSVFGSDFTSEYSTGAYDVTFHVTEIAAAGPGGEVPDGDDVAIGSPLVVDRIPGDQVRLTWSASCRAGDTDYAVYEGRLGDPASLDRVICSTSGGLSLDLLPAHEGSFFVAVPTDGSSEGSYGDTSAGVERPRGANPCYPQSLGSPVCP